MKAALIAAAVLVLAIFAAPERPRGITGQYQLVFHDAAASVKHLGVMVMNGLTGQLKRQYTTDAGKTDWVIEDLKYVTNPKFKGHALQGVNPRNAKGESLTGYRTDLLVFAGDGTVVRCESGRAQACTPVTIQKASASTASPGRAPEDSKAPPSAPKAAPGAPKASPSAPRASPGAPKAPSNASGSPKTPPTASKAPPTAPPPMAPPK